MCSERKLSEMRCLIREGRGRGIDKVQLVKNKKKNRSKKKKKEVL